MNSEEFFKIILSGLFISSTNIEYIDTGGNRNTVRHGDGMRLRRSADESDVRVRRSAGCSPTTSSPISWFDRMCILAGYCSPQDLSDAPLDPNNCIPL